MNQKASVHGERFRSKWNSPFLGLAIVIFTLGLTTACTLEGINLAGAAGAQETLIAENLSATPFSPALTEIASQPPIVTSAPPATPPPPSDVTSALRAVDSQLQNSLQANIAFNKPESMLKGSTVTIELLLNPLMSGAELATELVSRGNFATSTAESGQLISPGGSELEIATGKVEITDRMKAVLTSQDPDAFAVQMLHDTPEQVISTLDTTKWRWSVTSKKQGAQKLDLVLYRLVKYEGQNYWREVKAYNAEINVKVTPFQQIETVLDWKVVGLIVTFLLTAFWRWMDSRKKTSPTKPTDPNTHSKPKKIQRN